jgi:protein-L-isoaspartate(D-aspartate) O-methyltransferase
VTDLALARAAMAERLGGIGFPAAVVAAMGRVKRHDFVPAPLWRLAYADADLWLGAAWLESPVAIARRLAALAARPGQRVLEMGTGSGYQTAVLAELGARVFTVETLGACDLSAGKLAPSAAIRRTLGGDATAFRDEAPFGAIAVNQPAEAVAPVLIARLAEGGRLVATLGTPPRLRVLRREGGAVRWRDAGVVVSQAVPRALPRLDDPLPLEGGRSEP